jgi:ectoine hydroxylase-related dioxygenase (phytanoyl-CoA dioxygenase family)
MKLAETGFHVVQECFSSRECSELVETLSAVSRSRAGARHLMAIPAVAAMANDKRLIDLARRWVGDSAVAFRATLFEKSAETNWLIPWHQDTALPLARQFDLAGWGPWSQKAGVNYAHAPANALARVIALRLHLDQSGQDNGPLRVVPGSHRAGVLSDESVLESVSSSGFVNCCVEQGGVIAMRPLIVHSSSKAKNGKPRRVLHIEYADSIEMGDGISLAVV